MLSHLLPGAPLRTPPPAPCTWGAPLALGHSPMVPAAGPQLPFCTKTGAGPSGFGNLGWGQAVMWAGARALLLPTHAPASAPALPMLQALAEAAHVVLPIWPRQGSPGTQARPGSQAQQTHPPSHTGAQPALPPALRGPGSLRTGPYHPPPELMAHRLLNLLYACTRARASGKDGRR